MWRAYSSISPTDLFLEKSSFWHQQQKQQQQQQVVQQQRALQVFCMFQFQCCSLSLTKLLFFSFISFLNSVQQIEERRRRFFSHSCVSSFTPAVSQSVSQSINQSIKQPRLLSSQPFTLYSETKLNDFLIELPPSCLLLAPLLAAASAVSLEMPKRCIVDMFASFYGTQSSARHIAGATAAA